MNFGKTFDSIFPILGSLAPNIASMIGGPMAGMAVAELGKALGLTPEEAKDPTKIVAAVNNMTPETAAAMQKADNEFKIRMKELDLDPEKIAAADRANARQMQIQTKDTTPKIIAAAVIVGFFSLAGILSFIEVPVANHDILVALMGVLAAGVNSVLQYYFGSSSSSRAKDETIKQMAA